LNSALHSPGCSLREAKAEDLLAPIYGWFTESFDLPDLKAAAASTFDLHS
jgi:hypothetical protein